MLGSLSSVIDLSNPPNTIKIYNTQLTSRPILPQLEFKNKDV